MTSTYPSFTPTYHHEPYPTILPTQQHLSCQGLSVIVTGAGSGIGQAIAVAFAQAQAKSVILLGRTESTLHETAELVRKASKDQSEAVVVTADITDAEAVKSAFAKAQDQAGSIDILVNNAGGAHGSFKPIVDIDLDDFRRTFELNVLGPLTVTQAFMQAARTHDAENARPRTIINIASGAAHILAPTTAAYGSSKLAGARITEIAQIEHKDWRVFNLQPGVVATALAQKSGRKGEDTPELSAAMTVWLARDPRAQALTGRFIWANWDVDELLSMTAEIHEKELLRLGLKGWAEGYTVDSLLARAAAVQGNANAKKA